MSGEGFQVVLSDLERLAEVFRRESAVFEAIMPAGQAVTVADLLTDLLAEPSATLRGKLRELAEINEELSKWDPEERSIDDLLDLVDELGTGPRRGPRSPTAGT